MKRSAFFGVLALLASVPIVTAQEPLKPNMFSTLASCEAALRSGALRFYEPKYFGLRTQNPTNGRDLVVVSLESDICLEMLVVGGRRFVAQREGTLFRAQRLPDGSLSLYARDDCGNPVYGVVYPPPLPGHGELIPLSPAVPPDPPRFVGPELSRPTVVAVAPETKKKGFCNSKKCRLTLVAVGAAAGYAAWYYWPCPPGTVRK